MDGCDQPEYIRYSNLFAERGSEHNTTGADTYEALEIASLCDRLYDHWCCDIFYL